MAIGTGAGAERKWAGGPAPLHLASCRGGWGGACRCKEGSPRAEGLQAEGAGPRMRTLRMVMRQRVEAVLSTRGLSPYGDLACVTGT